MDAYSSGRDPVSICLDGLNRVPVQNTWSHSYSSGWDPITICASGLNRVPVQNMWTRPYSSGRDPVPVQNKYVMCVTHTVLTHEYTRYVHSQAYGVSTCARRAAYALDTIQRSAPAPTRAPRSCCPAAGHVGGVLRRFFCRHVPRGRCVGRLDASGRRSNSEDCRRACCHRRWFVCSAVPDKEIDGVAPLLSASG